MIKNKILHILGVFYMILGFIFFLNIFYTITGFAIAENISIKTSSLLGLILISIGLLVSITTRGTESELESKTKISVFNAKRGKMEEESLMMTDPLLYLENSGAISLSRFKREINHLRQGEGGEELVKIVKDSYEPALKEIAESNDLERAPIAQRFLQVLDPSYHSHQPREQEDYSLTKEEREEIKNAFRSYDGRLTSQQREVLRKYNLLYDNAAKNEAKLIYNGTGYTVTISKTPSDRRAGLNIVTDIIKVIERGRKHNSENQKLKKN